MFFFRKSSSTIGKEKGNFLIDGALICPKMADMFQHLPFSYIVLKRKNECICMTFLQLYKLFDVPMRSIFRHYYDWALPFFFSLILERRLDSRKFKRSH